MEAQLGINLGFRVNPSVFRDGFSYEKFIDYLSDRKNVNGRIFLNLREYLVTFSKAFDEANIFLTTRYNMQYPNGSLEGLSKLINESKIDVAIQPVIMHKSSMEIADFSYPYQLVSATFVIRKPEYKPQIFGILQTFSWPLWITILSILIAVSLMYYVGLKKKYTLDKVLLHSLVILLRQNSILKPTSMAENLLVYSWVVAAMFICFAYESVFLSFLAFSPNNPIKTIPELSKAILNADYHCVIHKSSAFMKVLELSSQEDVKVIERDIKTNNISFGDFLEDFLNDTVHKNLAYIVDSRDIDIYSVGSKFASEDRFSEIMAAIRIRKGFCCKNVLETFVHKLMASGLYSKYQNDKSFFFRLPLLLNYSEKDTSKRKLTLKDVAPAFIALSMGYFVSFSALIGEILTHRWKKLNYRIKGIRQRRIKILSQENPV